MEKPFVQLVRKTLKFKGSSEHNGRGAYEMIFDNDSWEKMKERVKVLENKMIKDGTFDKIVYWSKESPFTEDKGRKYEFITISGKYEVYSCYSEFTRNERNPFQGRVGFVMSPIR